MQMIEDISVPRMEDVDSINYSSNSDVFEGPCSKIVNISSSVVFQKSLQSGPNIPVELHYIFIFSSTIISNYYRKHLPRLLNTMDFDNWCLGDIKQIAC